MAIKLEFLNFIVPIEVIKKKYPGGWEQCLNDHANLIGGRVWFDKHLFRNGAMNDIDIGELLNKWRTYGFNTHSGDKTPTRWFDVCVVDESIGGVNLPCDWIEVENNTAFYKGKQKGDVIGREEIKQITML